MSRAPKYKTEEERKAARAIYKRNWAKAHPEAVRRWNQKYWDKMHQRPGDISNIKI